MTMRISLNTRFRTRPITGVERFAGEVSDRLAARESIEIHSIQPGAALAGLRGHAWEQFTLPGQIDRDSVLFSPCNTGPVLVKRQLVVMHDAAVWDCPEAFSRSFRVLYQNLLPAIAKRVAGIATVSEFSRGRLARHLKIAEEKIHVLGNATNSAFSPAEIPVSTDTPTLLCVGSLDPRKNFHRLIEAWIQLRKSNRLPEKARLNIIGSANPANFSQFDIIDAPGVHWLGRVSDQELIRCYQEATAFIFPSLYEGFGIPPLEAMACGCPVLLSKNASLPEIGGPPFDPLNPKSSGAALYFDPLSTAEIATAIETMLTLDSKARAGLVGNAVDHASKFSWDTVADRTERIIAAI